jgi:hypothetical protein
MSKTQDVVEKKGKDKKVSISPPNFVTAGFDVVGTAPLVMNKFSQKARTMMREKQEAGTQSKKGKTREARDFNEIYENALHVSTDGWYGIPANAFRAAMIGACRLVDFKMTISKLALFIVEDGYDSDEGTPLVKITRGKPIKHEMGARLESGVCDVRVRPMWKEWGCKLSVRFDADIFTADDVANLLMRAGMQVGILEGRPGSKDSIGMGWGTFTIVSR